jgi:nicotinamidase-related amidase
VVIDVQDGFDHPSWGPTSNTPGCEDNVARLLHHWRATDCGPVVIVQHHSVSPTSPLHPDQPGNQLKSLVTPGPGELLVTKSVSSAFYGEPDLHAWLTEQNVTHVVIGGIQTNMCVETTARMAGNLGYQVTVPWDATRIFDLTAEIPGLGHLTTTADELLRVTSLNLHAGGFARLTTTDAMLNERA